MSDLGDLDKLLKEESKSLAELDWLEISDEDYRKMETLPEQNLDAVPELEEQWKYLKDEDYIRLSPENREPSKPTTPFWSERKVFVDLTDDDQLKVVEDFVRKALQDGDTTTEVVAKLKSSFDKSTLSKSASVIKSSLKEAGLLGTVYVDSSLFPNCDKGEGQDRVASLNKTAKFVLAKDKCAGCVFAREGRCDRLGSKDLVASVDYSEDLWKHYKKLATSLNKDLSSAKQQSSFKERIRVASLAPVKGDAKGLDSKPVVRNLSDHISLDEARSRFAKMEATQEIVENLRVEKKVRAFAQRLLLDPTSRTLLDQIKMDADLEDLRKHAGLMGTLYADLSLFDSQDEANAFVQRNPSLLTYNSPADSEVKLSEFSLRSEEAINRILHRYALNRYGHDYLKKQSSILSRLGNRLATMSDETLREFASRVFLQPMPSEVKKYADVYNTIYDPTKGVKLEDAQERLRRAKADKVKVANPYHHNVRKDVLLRMMKGESLKSVQHRIASEGLTDIAEHAGVLGKLYRLKDVFASEAEEAQFLAKNVHLKALPVYTGPEFFRQEAVQKTILHRLALVQGIDPKDPAKLESFVSAKLPKIASKSPEDLRKLARTVFDKPVQQKSKYTKTAYYAAHYHLTDVEVTEADKRAFVENAKAMQPKAKQVLPEETARKVLSYAFSDSFEPKPSMKGRKMIPKQAFETKVGKFLRDQMVKGVYGSKLSSTLRQTFAPEDLLDDAHFVHAMRQEEGLYGRVYLTADSYEDCFEGKRQASSQISQIVKSDKCKGCVYNKVGQCLLYNRDLVAEVSLTEDMVLKAVNARVREGALTTEDAKALLVSDMPLDVKVASAYRSSSKNQKRVSESTATAYYGQVLETSETERKVGDMLKSATTLAKQEMPLDEALDTLESTWGQKVMKAGMLYVKQIFDRVQNSPEKVVAKTSTTLHAQSGLDQLAEIDLLSTTANNPLDNIEINEAKTADILEGISLDGFDME